MAAEPPRTAASMEKKRRLPPRGSRVESISKKAKSSTPEQTPSPAPGPTPTEPVVEPLPFYISANSPLPTVDKPQPKDLSVLQYQSIRESGVMAESLDRSRKKWLSEGLFQKYWSKPVKKKGVTYEEPGNPSKDTMTKVGVCKIYIEPHEFDAVMFVVKDTSAKPPFQPPPQPMYRPIIQYGPPNGIMPPPPPPPPPTPPAPAQSSNVQPAATPARLYQQTVNGAPTAAQSPMQNQGAPQHHTAQRPLGVAPLHPHSTPPQPTYHTIAPPAQQQSSRPPTPAAPPSKSSDPVIQMLAERAASDPDLKALMRIVADGKATPEELKRFQSHIDELSQLLATRNAAAAAAAAAAAPPTPVPVHSSAHPGPPNVVRHAPLPPQLVRPQQPPPMQQHYAAHAPPQPQPQALRSRAPLPPARSDISAVVFEFSGGSGDRFLFPKHSILDFSQHSCKVICSFLIVRKGTTADAKKYDPALDYYQPVTIRIETHLSHPRLLDALTQVVAPPDDVRRYMNDIMDNMTRAEYVLLAMQLPREGDNGLASEEDVVMKDGPASHNNGVMWTATANGTAEAPKQKQIKKQPTEEQQYSNFISSVS